MAHSRVADWGELEREASGVIGQRTGQRIKIGDPMRVTIAAILLSPLRLRRGIAHVPFSKQA